MNKRIVTLLIVGYSLGSYTVGYGAADKLSPKVTQWITCQYISASSGSWDRFLRNMCDAIPILNQITGNTLGINEQIVNNLHELTFINAFCSWAIVHEEVWLAQLLYEIERMSICAATTYAPRAAYFKECITLFNDEQKEKLSNSLKKIVLKECNHWLKKNSQYLCLPEKDVCASFAKRYDKIYPNFDQELSQAINEAQQAAQQKCKNEQENSSQADKEEITQEQQETEDKSQDSRQESPESKTESQSTDATSTKEEKKEKEIKEAPKIQSNQAQQMLQKSNSIPWKWIVCGIGGCAVVAAIAGYCWYQQSQEETEQAQAA